MNLLSLGVWKKRLTVVSCFWY